MISLGAVSLKAARQDCGLPASGPMNIQEFRDRVGGGNFTLKGLSGTVLCKSKNATSGNYDNRNYNPGRSCRPNVSEANVYTANAIHLARLRAPSSGNLEADCEGNWQHFGLAGHSFVGRAAPGRNIYRWNVEAHRYNEQAFPERIQLEIIGWRDGYFVGTPKYYTQTMGYQNLIVTNTVAMDGNEYPYVTAVVQNLANSSNMNYTYTKSFRLWWDRVG